MEPTEVTIEILGSIRAGIAALREDMNARFAEHAESLEKLHVEMTLANETLGVIRERLTFAEAAVNAGAEGRQ